MVEGRHRASRGGSGGSSRRRIANEQRLTALGEAVDAKNGVSRPAKRRGRSRLTRNLIIGAVSVFVVIALLLGGGYLYANWRFSQIHKITVASEVKPISGAPFNILSVGSDSRQGLTGLAAAQSGATTGQASGQRSDVVKVIHVDPQAGTISILSIPRDTMVTLLANQSLYGKFNRVNVNFAKGPSLVAQTITANFGIPINNTIVVSFSGLINAAIAVGGVYLDFPYPAHDTYSGLRIRHAGCQLVSGFQALAVARSRHYYYAPKGNPPWPKNGANMSDAQLARAGWYYDPTSDFGRIKRQDAFLNALISRAKGLYNPITINAFLSKIPQGITIDSNFSLNELIGLALKFHGISTKSIHYYTLPTSPGVAPNVGDVLFTNQPVAQRMLVTIFGSQLRAPTNPPPNTRLQTPMPPVIPVTTPPSTTSSVKSKHVATTTTTLPVDQNDFFDPVPCSK
jgi:LCP family protein required for cell wall assembly